MKKAIFLDKDGTLIYNIPYNVNSELIRLTKGAVEGLKKLAKNGFEFFIITNQHGIALKYFTKKDLFVVQKKLKALLAVHGIRLSGFYYCPHHKNDSCLCRKPRSGLLMKAAYSHRINTRFSWMIGDTPDDVAAGKDAGCKTILFDKGYENKWNFTKVSRPDFIVNSLDQAANIILEEEAVLDEKNY